MKRKTLDELINELLYQFEISVSKEAEREINKLSSKRSQIEEEYQKLIAYCKSLTSGKAIEEYLEELGFDLTDLRKDNGELGCTDLVPQINKENLFIGGLN